MELAPHFWVGLGEIILVDIILSGDNAVVIALASRNLPPGQRNKAIFLGSAGAIALRVVFCLFVATLMRIPYIKLVGSVLLLWVGVKLLRPEHAEYGKDTPSNVWGAVRTIFVADAVMSLDNAMAIAGAARNDYLLIALGLLLSIPLIVFGSQFIIKATSRFPIIIVAGAGLIGWIAGDVGITDPAIAHFVEGYGQWLDYAAKIAGAVLVIVLGKWLAGRAKRRQEQPIDIAVRH